MKALIAEMDRAVLTVAIQLRALNMSAETTLELGDYTPIGSDWKADSVKEYCCWELAAYYNHQNGNCQQSVSCLPTQVPLELAL